MPIFKPIQESEAEGKVKEIYDEIKKVRKISLTLFLLPIVIPLSTQTELQILIPQKIR